MSNKSARTPDADQTLQMSATMSRSHRGAGREALAAIRELYCVNCARIIVKVWPGRQLDNMTHVPREGLQLAYLGFIGKLGTSSKCPLCQLLAQCRSVSNGPRGIYDEMNYQLRAFRELPGSHGLKSSAASSAPRLLCVAPASQKKFTSDRHNKTLTWNGIVACVDKSGQDGPLLETSVGLDKQLVNGGIDFAVFRDAIDKCQSYHALCKDDGRKWLPVKVIDCMKPALVDLPVDAEYVALSYCWGGISQGPVPSQDTLISIDDLPRTIQHAIVATTGLGQRYIWVDSLCVPGEAGAKKDTLRNMDQIYQNSIITIVALYGKDANGGLPGVAEIPQVPLPCVGPLDKRYLLALPASLTTVIGRSQWNTRGWTYQEARLSSRCLFFSHDQVYFACKSTSCCQLVPHSPLDDPSCPISLAVNDVNLGPQLFDMAVKPNEPLTRGFMSDLRQFCIRDLSRPSDRLDAFRGLLQISGVYSYCGIPLFPQYHEKQSVYLDFDLSLACGLAWQPENPSPVPWEWDSPFRSELERRLKELKHARCADIPSWTWAVDFRIPQLHKKTVGLAFHVLGEVLCISSACSTKCKFFIPEFANRYVSVKRKIKELGRPRPLPEHQNFQVLRIQGPVYQTFDLARLFSYAYDRGKGKIFYDYTNDSKEMDVEAVRLLTIPYQTTHKAWRERHIFLIVKRLDGRKAHRLGIAFYNGRLAGFPSRRRRIDLV